MFNKILVAIDASASRAQVFEQAIALAKSMQAQLRVLQVVTANEADFPHYPLAQTDVGFVLDETVYEEILQRYTQERQAFEDQHLSQLQAIAEDAIAEGISTDYALAYGSPGKQICQMAADWQADAIVLGRRGNLGLQELWLGSVSNYVVHHAPCSVLVIQGSTVAKAGMGAAASFAEV